MGTRRGALRARWSVPALWGCVTGVLVCAPHFFFTRDLQHCIRYRYSEMSSVRQHTARQRRCVHLVLSLVWQPAVVQRFHDGW